MAKKKKYLILSVSNEHQSNVAVIEWNVEREAQIRNRIVRVSAIHKADSDVAHLSFYDGVELFEYGADLEEWLVKNKVVEDWENDVVIANNHPCSDGEEIRIDTVRLNVSPSGFWWVILPKHQSVYMETPYFSLDSDRTRKLLKV